MAYNLLPKIRKIVASYCKAGCIQVDEIWRTLPIDGEASVWEEEKKLAKDAISMSIIAVGQKAWIAEYGKGSLMESSGVENPFLQDYVSGKVKDEDGNPLFNRERLAHAFAIVGRPHGYYYDIDGNRYHSHGNLKGKVIEDSNNYVPQAPRHVIKKILFGDGEGGILSDMCEEIQNACMGVLMGLIIEKFPKEIKLYDK